MSKLRLISGFVGLASLVAYPIAAYANTYSLRRDNVIPIVFKDNLTLRDNRPGDTFSVRVTDNGQLPRGTELLGRIDRIHEAHGNRPASMDMRFTAILLPDDSRVPLDAAPIPLDDRYITRYGDGRIVAKSNFRQQQADVIGGAIGGYIVGSIFHRRITGTIIGTMIGISAAESDRRKDMNVVVSAGDKAGALINRDVIIDFSDAPSRYRIREHLDEGMNIPVRGTEVEDFSNLTLRFRRNDLDFPEEARPYRVGGTIMIPLERAARQMGLDVDRRPDRTVYVDGPDSTIRLSISSRQARLDGRKIDLPRSVREREGVIYVPLEALTPLLKDDLYINGSRFGGN